LIPACRSTKLAAMSEANKTLAKDWFEQVWNQKSDAAIDRLLHPNAKCFGFPDANGFIVGPEAFKAVHRSFVGAFPDIQVELQQVIAEGDYASFRWVATMTHVGDHLGFPASGKTATLAGSGFIKGDGIQILDAWNYMDLHQLFQKLQSF
jgi:predicted ester cyclase